MILNDNQLGKGNCWDLNMYSQTHISEKNSKNLLMNRFWPILSLENLWTLHPYHNFKTYLTTIISSSPGVRSSSCKRLLLDFGPWVRDLGHPPVSYPLYSSTPPSALFRDLEVRETNLQPLPALTDPDARDDAWYIIHKWPERGGNYKTGKVL